MRKTILIIGGSGTLGQNLTPRLVTAGYDVIIGDIWPPAGNTPARYIQMDATDPDSLQDACARIEADGIQVTHIMNTVGLLAESGLTDIFQTSAEEIQRTIDVNLLSQILPVRFFGEHLMTGDGDKSFVLVSSVNAHTGYSIPFYSAAKGGLHSFIRPAAMQLGAGNVRINIVTPGTVITPETETQPKNFADRAEAAALKRLCSVDEIAEAMLCCVKLTGMTGQEIVVDAGQSLNPSESLFDQQRRGTVPPTSQAQPA